MSNELAIIEKLELVPFFTKGDQLDETLDKIKVEAMAHVPDVSTLKGRNAIKANVTKVTKSKTFLESHGKDLAAEYKLIPKAIDANRKKSKDFLNALVEEIREPLTAWEAIDKAEKKQIADTAAYLIKFAADVEEGYRDNELIDLRAKQAEADRQAEIKAAADKAAAEAKAKAEFEASEKIAQAERDKIAAQQREIATKQAAIDAENKATQDAIDTKAREDKAAQDALNATIIAKRQADQAAERAKQDAIDAKENARIEAERAESRRVIALETAKRNAEIAEERRIEAERQAIRNSQIAAENAKQDEIQRRKDASLREEIKQAKLEADKDHTASINREVMADFIRVGLDDAAALLATKALAAKKIRYAGINY